MKFNTKAYKKTLHLICRDCYNQNCTDPNHTIKNIKNGKHRKIIKSS